YRALRRLAPPAASARARAADPRRHPLAQPAGSAGRPRRRGAIVCVSARSAAGQEAGAATPEMGRPGLDRAGLRPTRRASGPPGPGGRRTCVCDARPARDRPPAAERVERRRVRDGRPIRETPVDREPIPVQRSASHRVRPRAAGGAAMAWYGDQVHLASGGAGSPPAFRGAACDEGRLHIPVRRVARARGRCRDLPAVAPGGRWVRPRRAGPRDVRAPAPRRSERPGADLDDPGDGTVVQNHVSGVSNRADPGGETMTEEPAQDPTLEPPKKKLYVKPCLI